MLTCFELCPADGRKSFYGKASIIAVNGCIYLRSYDTIVAMIDRNGSFKRLWNGYSNTTMRHVNAFRRLYGLPSLGKCEWLALPLVKGI